MYKSSKAWFRKCNKKLLSAVLCHCLDLAIYSDLFNLKQEERENDLEANSTWEDNLHRLFAKVMVA